MADRPCTYSSTEPASGLLEEELWRRAQVRRELDLYPELSAEERLLLPLVLSLARLAAQRDAKRGRESDVHV